MSIFLGAIAVLALGASFAREFWPKATGTSAEWAIVSGLFFIACVLA